MLSLTSSSNMHQCWDIKTLGYFQGGGRRAHKKGDTSTRVVDRFDAMLNRVNNDNSQCAF